MTVQRAVHLLAGTMVLASVGLGYFATPYWAPGPSSTAETGSDM